MREKIQPKDIKAEHICSKSQLADLLTKALGRDQFQSLTCKLGILNPHCSNLKGTALCSSGLRGSGPGKGEPATTGRSNALTSGNGPPITQGTSSFKIATGR